MKYKVTYRDCIDESCSYQMIDTIILSDETLEIFLRTHKNKILNVEMQQFIQTTEKRKN